MMNLLQAWLNSLRRKFNQGTIFLSLELKAVK
jgi:hypothetical protein